MAQGWFAELPDRGVVEVAGPEAQHFLQNLVTTDIDAAVKSGAGYGALLTPQGKVLFDFIVHADGGRFLLDLPRAMAADLIRRLGLYKLRAQVRITDRSADDRVVVAWGAPATLPSPAAADPRHPELGMRAIVRSGDPFVPPDGFAAATAEDWQAHRVALGIPEGGADFAYGDAFPHEADLDQLGGVGFAKGCYIGQEVVSRMEHRGTARRRIIRVEGVSDLPAAGGEITADGRALGTLGSVAGRTGLASIRLDRAREELDAGRTVTIAGIPVTLTIPDWARFGWPAKAAE